MYDVNLVGNEGDRPVIFIVKYYFNVHFIDLLSDVLELVKPAYNKVQKRKKFLFSVELQDWGESENSYANFLIERRSFCFFGNVLRSMGGQFLEDFCNIVFGKNFVLYEKLLEEDLREQIQGKFVMSHYR